MPVTPTLNSGRIEQRLALDHEGQAEQQQRHGHHEAERHVERDAGRGDGNDAHGVREIAPGDVGERRALAGAQQQDQAERHHQADHELGQHAGPGRGQRAERQVAAHRQNERAGDDERAAGDMVPAQDHGHAISHRLARQVRHRNSVVAEPRIEGQGIRCG